jgi:hypothetical protein
MKVYRLPHYVHPLKDEAWLENEKKRNTEDELAREVLISYDFSVAGIVFKEFKPFHISRAEYKPDPTWQTLIGWDFGRTCADLFIQVDNYDCLHIFKEHVLVGQGTDDLVKVTQSYASKLEDLTDWFYFCDPAGNSPDHRTKTTDVQILEDAGFRPLHYHKALAMPKRREDGVQMIKKFLNERVSGRERITVYEQGCPTLVEAFQSGYRYKENVNGETLEVIDEVHPYEEVIDILRYALIERFTVAKKKKPGECVTVAKSLSKVLRR